MNQQKYSSSNHTMRYPCIFPETRANWEEKRNQINNTIDELLDSDKPLEFIIQRITHLSKRILLQK